MRQRGVTKTFSRWLLAAALLAGAAPAVGFASPACAAETSAALVVDTGDAATSYCVILPDDTVTGIELIQLAGEQHGLQYRLGFGGKAVCQLQGVGPDGDDCFEDYPDFWGYWRGDGSGGWEWSNTGAGSTTVEPGDVEGWAWGSGQDGSTHPQPPPTKYSSVCATAVGGGGSAEPAAENDGDTNQGRDGRQRGDATRASGGTGGERTSATTEGAAENDAPPGAEDRRKKKERREAAPEDADEGPASAPEDDGPDAAALDGPPADEDVSLVGLAGLGGALVLAAAAALAARRRSRSER